MEDVAGLVRSASNALGDEVDEAGDVFQAGGGRCVASEDLHTLAKALLEYETLTGDEIVNALKGVPPHRDESEAKRPTGPSVAVPISPKPSAEPA